MESLAQTLGFKFTDLDTDFDFVPRTEDGSVDSEADVDSLRKYLEDTLNLVNLADDPVVDVEAVEVNRSDEDGIADEEDDDEDEDAYQ